MSRVYFGLHSTEGDRLGHLVRGVQMLRSYGHEAEIDEYSDVVNVTLTTDDPPAFACVISGQSAATLEALKGICRETEWALGKMPESCPDGEKEPALSVRILQFDDQQLDSPRFFEAVRTGKLTKGMTVALDKEEFERICGWGQIVDGEPAEVAGEWPSATGR